jgi:hypothetical protein
MNVQLQKLYQRKWSDLVANSAGTESAYPLLIKIHDEYIDADVKVMIVGQETDGWEGELEQNDKNITHLMNTYYNYYHNSPDKNRRPFWNRKGFLFFQEELTKYFSKSKVGFIWNNVSKLGHAHRGGQPSQRISELECNYFNVFNDELKILKPDIVILTIGDRIIPVEHEPIKPVGQNPVSEVHFVNYPHLIAVRTYHPNARIKGGKVKLKNGIIELIKEKYNQSSDPT